MISIFIFKTKCRTYEWKRILSLAFETNKLYYFLTLIPCPLRISLSSANLVKEPTPVSTKYKESSIHKFMHSKKLKCPISQKNNNKMHSTKSEFLHQSKALTSSDTNMPLSKAIPSGNLESYSQHRHGVLR